MKMKSNQHGGWRPGAGRKAAGTRQLIIRPKVATIKRLKAEAKRSKRTLGQVVDQLVGTDE